MIKSLGTPDLDSGAPMCLARPACGLRLYRGIPMCIAHRDNKVKKILKKIFWALKSAGGISDSISPITTCMDSA